MKTAQAVEQLSDTTEIDNLQLEIGPGGSVVVYTSEEIETKPATEEGLKVEVADDGHLVVYTDGTVTTHPLAADGTIPPKPLEPGQKMPDGTFYLGRFQDEKDVEKDDFAAAADAEEKKGPLRRKSKAHGHKDWTVPAANVLNAIFNLKAKIPGLDLNNPEPFYAYRSSTPSEYAGYTKVQRFADGAQFYDHKSRKLPIRLVRGVAV